MDRILVTASTGNVGQPLVQALKNKNVSFEAATRDAENAREVLGPEVKTTYLDYEDPDSFGSALDGNNVLFLCGPSATPNAGELIMPLVDEAEQAGINHIVFIASHPEVKDAIKESGIDYTFISANFFMQNFELYQTEEIRDRQQLFLPCGEGKASFIHCRDIGQVAAEVLSNPGEYKEETLTITGPQAVSLYDAAAVFSEVLDENIEYVNPDEASYRSELQNRGYDQAYIDGMVAVFGKIKEGEAAHTTTEVEQILGRKPLTLKTYAEENKARFSTS